MSSLEPSYVKPSRSGVHLDFNDSDRRLSKLDTILSLEYLEEKWVRRIFEFYGQNTRIRSMSLDGRFLYEPNTLCTSEWKCASSLSEATFSLHMIHLQS